MVSKMEACAECARSCMLYHGQMRDPSSVVTSFFKVMIGDNHSELMFLPPKFTRTVSALVDQTTHLEDSSGRNWTVTLSNVDGSLAFQKGWHDFSLDHGLKVGDFLVFNYIRGSHFIVHIYGKTGCQEVRFSEENGNQKKRSRTNFIAKDGLCHTINNGSMNQQGSSTPFESASMAMATDNSSNFNNGLQFASAIEYVEEPFYLIDRDIGYQQGEYKSALFDLSNFETGRSKFDANGNNKVSVEDELNPNTMMQSRTEAGIVAPEPVPAEAKSWVSPSEMADFAKNNNDSRLMDKVALMSKKDSDSRLSSRHLLETSATKPAENSKNSASMSKIVRCQKRSNTRSSTQISLKKFSGISEFSGSPVTNSMLKRESGEMMKMVKKELVEKSELCSFEELLHGKDPNKISACGQSSRLSVKNNDKEVFKVVKTEPVVSFDFSTPDAAKISCLVVMGGQPFLELSKSLPSNSLRRASLVRKVVLLRDPVSRLWPVLYHEKNGLKALTSGWEAFSKSNCIQPGDECVFGLENEAERIYRVGIARK